MNNKRILLILVALLIVGGLFYWNIDDRNQQTTSVSTNATASHPVFKKEGEVVFWKGDKKVVKVDVEIAGTEHERAQGLMYRPSMPDSVGMLFIFEWEAPQAFWMKNTSIPLDIVYVNSQKEIVSIIKNATPYSEESLPSERDAQYVVEVVAGFTDRFQIQVGDKISF